MGRPRAVLAWLAALSAAGCTLISGAADLDVEPGSDVGLPDASREQRGDGAPTSDANGGRDGAVDGAPSDASAPDTSTVIRAITFENGALVDPATGADRITGTPQLVSADAGTAAADGGDASVLPPPIGGSWSMLVSTSSSYAEADFPAQDQVYVSARFRLEEAPSTLTLLFRLFNDSGSPNVDVFVTPGPALRVVAGGQFTGVSNGTLDVGKVYRLGLHVRKGRNSNGELQAYVVPDSDPFGAPFASTRSLTIGRPNGVTFGRVYGSAVATFDDVKIDPTTLP